MSEGRRWHQFNQESWTQPDGLGDELIISSNRYFLESLADTRGLDSSIEQGIDLDKILNSVSAGIHFRRDTLSPQ
jgi:hypothetical protein